MLLTKLIDGIMMKPQKVINNVTDMSIWEDAIWVNEYKHLFFVPIWRCGNSTFMMEVAEKHNFELIKSPDLEGYTGFTFIRHPLSRIKGQIWMAAKNTNLDVNEILSSLNNGIIIDDPHLRSQVSFLKDKNIEFYIDLDNLHSTGYTTWEIQEVIDTMNVNQIRHLETPSEFQLRDRGYNMSDIVRNVYKEDLEFYYDHI